jgi:hypothetical protein
MEMRIHRRIQLRPGTSTLVRPDERSRWLAMGDVGEGLVMVVDVREGRILREWRVGDGGRDGVSALAWYAAPESGRPRLVTGMGSGPVKVTGGTDLSIVIFVFVIATITSKCVVVIATTSDTTIIIHIITTPLMRRRCGTSTRARAFGPSRPRATAPWS